MKYAVVKCVNGTFSIGSEWTDNKQGAIVNFHQTSANLWNDAGEVEATVKIVDDKFDTVDGYVEFISHSAKNA